MCGFFCFQEIVIVDCGEIKPNEDWGVNDDDETKENLPPFPQDWEDKLKDFLVLKCLSL